jgi:hypothetical protein
MTRTRKKPLSRVVLSWLAYTVVAIGFQVGIAALLYLSEQLRPKPQREIEVTWIQTPPRRPLPQTPTPTPIPPERQQPVARALPPVPPPPQPPQPQPPQPKEPTPPVAKTPPPPKPEEKKKPAPTKPPEVKEPPKVAIVPQPPKPEMKPPEEQKPQPEKEKAQIPKERHKAVEVDDDKNVVKEPPADADYLSDKNRSVAEQTRDTRSNLEKQMNGKSSPSEKSPDTSSEEAGGEEQEVHQVDKAEASSLDKKLTEPPPHSGDKDKSIGLQIGKQGQQGSKGQSGDGGAGGTPGALSMRNIDGRGAPGMDHSVNVSPSLGANDDAPEVALSKTPGTSGMKEGDGGKVGAPGKPGKRGAKLALDFDTYERVIGSDKYKDEIALGQRQKSHKKGRWEKKLDAIHSSLENFVPEVKPGNQNALGTRAAPFAVYIARVHRKIHELWGFGFLSDLDSKSPTDAMNNRDLKVTLEIVLNGDGTVDNVTIVRGSGVLTFDVAGIDSVMSAGPFEKPPGEIVSGNGKVYLHWTFHRDERQCSPYFADPFILDNAPPGHEKNGIPEPSEEIARGKQERKLERISRDGSPTKSNIELPHVTREQVPEGDPAAAARAAANLPAPDDPAAQDAALRWANAFESADIGAMVGASGVPFRVGGQKLQEQGELGTVWRGVLAEVASHDIKEWKVLSPAGYRAVFGRLPKGAEDAKLYIAARVGKEWLTLELGQGADGKLRVVGLYR